MSNPTGASPFCIPCERSENWIEFLFVDEHNVPFKNIQGQLTDASGATIKIQLKDEPTLVKTLAPGPVTLMFDNVAWLNESQQRTSLEEAEEETVSKRLESVGYDSSSKKLITATAGDFVELQSGQVLPPKHVAEAEGEVTLITNNSYVIKIKGFNYITLRVGLFFDGTANNTYSSDWGLEQIKRYNPMWQSRFETASHNGSVPIKDLDDRCFQFPQNEKFCIPVENKPDENQCVEVYEVTSSAANEHTNIQKLFERYPDGRKPNMEERIAYHSEYVTGIGTGNSTDIAPADESLLGQGLGIGDYGVTQKAETGIKQLCGSLKDIRPILLEVFDKFDGIKKIELDAWGFSRGAAAARHFINLVLEGVDGIFVSQITQACQDNNINFAVNFDWQDNRYCEITFAGIFDTVAAITDFTKADFSPHNDKTGNVKLWLDPARVKHAVHLTAHRKAEYRYNFCLNKFNSASNFIELEVPGCHSDIGGGYYASATFDKGYLLPLLENKCVKTLTQRGRFDNSELRKIQTRFEDYLQQHKEKEIAMGWKDSHFMMRTYVTNWGKNQKQISTKLYYRRVVQGDLSRLYLRLMYGLACHYGVPLDDKVEDMTIWNNKDFPTYIVPQTVGSIPFGRDCETILKDAKNGEIDKIIKSLCNDERLHDFMQNELIHHSADGGIANHPFYNDDDSIACRQIFECKQGQ
ncbi:phospholipase effector Tle1 domain-containing protein [Photobacterium sp. GB-36]|uniref:phospholipase effector Tle1 domain-containing protein n=1 Tax=Photobacterium sp. GB-36 TaxID=2022108 RepID=UPI000D16ECB0|nr:DUF2235 domain-containing protein [Photobacterium sp. GB-36]PSV40418.1 hypothetical protein C9J46_19780 [Photobacterium sp. GB-36]